MQSRYLTHLWKVLYKTLARNDARHTNLGLLGSRGRQLGGRAAAAGYASQDSQPGWKRGKGSCENSMFLDHRQSTVMDLERGSEPLGQVEIWS